MKAIIRSAGILVLPFLLAACETAMVESVAEDIHHWMTSMRVMSEISSPSGHFRQV